MKTVLFKYHKPANVLSTTLRDIPRNIIDFGNLSANNRRQLLDIHSKTPIFPVGRLDKDSSGLLFITNSEKLCERLLKTLPNEDDTAIDESDDDEDSSNNTAYGSKFSKVYEVVTKSRLSDSEVARLRVGVVISTQSRNRGGGKNVRPTLPIGLERLPMNARSEYSFGAELAVAGLEPPLIEVEQLAEDLLTSRKLQFTLREGRNRQIRKMVGRFGHAVESLHRVSFGGVTLHGILNPGDMLPLNREELAVLGLRVVEARPMRKVA